MKLRSLEPQQECLGGQSAAVAAEFCARRQHPVAGHDDRDRIVMIGLSDGAVGVGASDGASDVGVALCLAVRNAQQLFPALLLKFGSAEIERHGEIASLAGEVLVELLPNVGRLRREIPATRLVARPAFAEFAAKRQYRQCRS